MCAHYRWGNRDMEVETFLSASDFFDALKERETLPDIIFLDIEMPKIDGITLGWMFSVRYNRKLMHISSGRIPI